MNHILCNYINRIYAIYLDDILVYSKDPNEYTKYVTLILEKLQEYSLKVDLDKSEFNQKEVEFLEHIIRKNSIQIDSWKVQSILEQPALENLKDLQVFLRLTNYY